MDLQLFLNAVNEFLLRQNPYAARAGQVGQVVNVYRAGRQIRRLCCGFGFIRFHRLQRLVLLHHDGLPGMQVAAVVFDFERGLCGQPVFLQQHGHIFLLRRLLHALVVLRFAVAQVFAVSQIQFLVAETFGNGRALPCECGFGRCVRSGECLMLALLQLLQILLPALSWRVIVLQRENHGGV